MSNDTDTTGLLEAAAALDEVVWGESLAKELALTLAAVVRAVANAPLRSPFHLTCVCDACRIRRAVRAALDKRERLPR